jgi:hypothetical protein
LIALQKGDTKLWGYLLSFAYYFIRSLSIPAGEDDMVRIMLRKAEYRSLANASGTYSC